MLRKYRRLGDQFKSMVCLPDCEATMREWNRPFEKKMTVWVHPLMSHMIVIVIIWIPGTIAFMNTTSFFYVDGWNSETCSNICEHPRPL
mmetsp:Transcript_32340/g.67468  ORF Transcript_32340/g.67468 Transcript_32340/m.67468 type:complete len:89 (+) Transcript_32340:452-718(+)